MRRLVLPKTVKDLMDPRRQEDLREGVRILNAMQNLKMVINSTGATSTAGMQTSGPAALIALSANRGSIVNGPVAQILVVASGGGGGHWGGGGAGEVIYEAAYTLDRSSYAINVGAGGPGGNQFFNGVNGHGASFGGIFNAQGGGGGGRTQANGAPGGSGGGGGANVFVGEILFGGVSTATIGQGNGGGATPGLVNSPCGGGGGAGAPGKTGSPTPPNGAGGIGVAYSISGSSVYYGGGGGGGGFSAGASSGGLGGGGNGVTGTVSTGANGTNGLGGGGGGGGTGGIGGTGVVIVRYPGAPRFTGGTVTSVAGDTIHTFTAAGTLTAL